MAEKLTVQDLISDADNANLGSAAGDEALDHSLETYGIVRPVCVDKDDVLIAGNRTHLAAGRAGLKKVIYVESDGDALIVHRRIDLDFDSEDLAIRAMTRGASLADNQIGKISQNVDMAKVRQQILECAIIPSTCGFTQAEIVPVTESTNPFTEAPGPEVARSDDQSEGQQSVQRMRQVVVNCESEEQQQRVYEMLTELGLNPELRML